MAWRSALAWFLGLDLALLVGVLAAGQLGAFSGTAPSDLGVANGRLKAPATTPNSVSSQAALHAGHPMQQAAAIHPLPLQGSPAHTMARLRQVALALPGASLAAEREGYLYLQVRSRWLGFVDDVEFWADPAAGVVQLRSASRIGRKVFGVNRARIEQVRAALLAAG